MGNWVAQKSSPPMRLWELLRLLHACFGEAPPLEGGPESASLAQHAIRFGLTPAPFEGAPVGQAPPSWGRVGVSKAVLQRLHTKLELVQPLSQPVDACCPVVLAGTCRQGLHAKLRWGRGAVAESQRDGGPGESWRRRGCPWKAVKGTCCRSPLQSVAKRKKCKRNRAKKNV